MSKKKMDPRKEEGRIHRVEQTHRATKRQAFRNLSQLDLDELMDGDWEEEFDSHEEDFDR